MLSSLVTMLPWLLGAHVALGIVRKYTHLAGVSAVAIGSGGYAGYLIFAFLIWVADQLRLSLLAPELALPYAILSAICFALLVRRFSTRVSTNGVAVLLIIVVALYVVWSFFISGTAPISGWDAIDYWAKKASHFVDHSYAEYSKSYSDRDAFRHVSRHPLTLSLVHAWHMWANTVFEHLNAFSITPWSLGLLSIFAITSGASIYITSSRALGVVAGLMSLTIPLLENHTLIGGYTEIWVSTGLISSIAWLLMGKEENNLRFFSIGVTFSLTIVFLRNTGFVYALIPIVALSLATLVEWAKKKNFNYLSHQFSPLIISVAAVVFLASNISVYKISGSDFDVVFAGRVLSFALPGLADVSVSELNSKVLNQSFTLSFLILIVAIFSVVFSKKSRSSRSLDLIVSAQTIGYLLLTLSLFTDHGLRHALPGFDTGHSRFAIPVSCLTPMLCAALTQLLTSNGR